jgi:hypothetical protein
MRTIFTAVVAIAAAGLAGLQSARAYTAPWCAVTNHGNGSMYWDCQYSSIEQCRPSVLGGNRGWCNPNPYFVPYADAPNKHYRKRHARSQ